MLASNKNKSAMIRDIRRLEKNLKGRVSSIEKREDLPQFGAESFRKFERRMNKLLQGKRNLGALSEEQIQTLHRDIRYLNDLKSTSIKGATKARDVYKPVKEKIDALSPKLREKFWEIYNKTVERFGYMDMYKYELFETNIDYLYSGETDVDQAVAEIFKQYDKTLRELRGEGDEETVRILFTQRLQDLFK